VPNSFERRREALGERLRELRAAAGYETGKEFAQAVRWNAPKVSKIENGRQTASVEDVETWLAVVGAPADVADEVRAMLAAVLDAYVTWKDKVRTGHRARQEESVTREGRARLIRAFEIGAVPGLVQTADYARCALTAHAELHGGGHDIDDAVRARMKRQTILFEPGREIELLFSEVALLNPIAPPEVMRGQKHRLIATIGTPGVRVGIIPTGVKLPYPLLHNWWVIDDVVLVETATAEIVVDDPDEVEKYNDLTDMFWTVAAEGDEARDLLAGATRS
jgi:transcriptional regulator with XRE-family HTH domain